MVSFTIYYLLMHFYLHVALKSQKFERCSILMASLERRKNQGSDIVCLAHGDTDNFLT